MSKIKTGLFALLGRLVWTLLATVGLPLAKRKLQDRRGARHDGRGGTDPGRAA